MRDDVNEMRKRLEALAADLLKPELRLHSLPCVYVAMASESGVDDRGSYYAMTSAVMASWLRSSIGDRWRGNAPAMMLHDQQIMNHTSDDLHIASGLFNASFAHELAHIAQVAGLCASETCDISKPYMPETVFRKVVEKPGRVDGLTDTRTAIFGHPPEFLRLMFHIQSRMQARGWYVPTSRLHVWTNAGLHPGEWYRDALGDECRRLAELPLAAVVAQLPVPREFSELWYRDVAEACSAGSDAGVCS